MFAAATSFFARTNISQNYTISTPASDFSSSSRSSTPGPSNTAAPLPQVAGAYTPPFIVGLWLVQPAVHNTTKKKVSIWTYNKRSSEHEQLSSSSKERAIEILKTEASALGRLRHPSILEMVEPAEETRSELVFATEPLLSSLQRALPRSSATQLDEVEIQKGVLQICKGLTFLHNSARLIHTNLTPESIMINSSGDWKISGMGLTLPAVESSGSSSKWEYPSYETRMPSYIQRSFDYMAPEYAIDERLLPEYDMYSLGCVLYAVHCDGDPPFRNRHSLQRLKDNAGRPLDGISRLEPDLRALLSSLITRHPTNRPSPDSVSSQPFFSSLSVSTLNFLDRSNFASKTREEKVSFMKGLTGVLDRFSEGLRTRKILPSLVEEMKDTHLLPYILPNVFKISSDLSSNQFASLVLPSLTPLFAIKEPPQNMITLLDNLKLLQDKTDKRIFKDHVLPLVYNALESEHGFVQERALSAVPDLCDTIDYAVVQEVLFPRVAFVFTKTRILSVKVATLVTFHSMIKTLDQASLTQKLAPLLAKIKTKEPAVMLATLNVHEAMGMKVDREAVATLVLPQLWTMSMGPLLNLQQFQRFMQVIKQLGERVEREHIQYLRDTQRLEDKSGTDPVNGMNGSSRMATSLDFESLVAGASTSTVKADSMLDSWDNDDVWGKILMAPTQSPQNTGPARIFTQPALAPSSPTRTQSTSTFTPASRSPLSSPPLGTVPKTLGSLSTIRPMSMASSFPLPPPQSQFTQPPSGLSSVMAPSKPVTNIFTPFTPSPPPPPVSSLPPPWQSTFGDSVFPTTTSSAPSTPQMGMNSFLTPSPPARPPANAPKKLSSQDWGDFDPLA